MYSLPETYYITKSTPYVPNSPLPVLVYRGALTSTPTAESIKALIEPNGWLQGGIFKHYPAHHFHSLTHDCYAVFKGRSRLLLGKGPLDDATGDGMTDGNGDRNVEVTVGVGDAIVLPAGVAHCCLESEGEYEYVGLYPKGSPHWDNNFCRASAEETEQKERNARAVPIPLSDPIFGTGGALIEIWGKALAGEDGGGISRASTNGA